jgi:hypothetical protein
MIALVGVAAVSIAMSPVWVQAEQPGHQATPADSVNACDAADLLVSQGWPANGVGENYYGGAEWPQMTTALNTAANSVTVTADLEDLAEMLQYDALWIDQRDFDGSPHGPGELTSTEVTNVIRFIATGRRVVMMGENPWWTDWNNQILGTVGGVFGGEMPTWTLETVRVHELTVGVSTVYANAGGYCYGGTSLFNHNFATLWAVESVLTILDVNFLSDDYWTYHNNAQFSINIAEWIGCKSPQMDHILFIDGGESGGTDAWSAVVP